MAAQPSAAAAAAAAAATDDAARSLVECNVCFEAAREPVVTLCGHLYCWPCLYRWLASGHTSCPVCKAGVTREAVIPLYGRGNAGPARAPGTTPGGIPAPGADDVPGRPPAQRQEARPRGGTGSDDGGWGGGGGGGGTFTVGYGFFPSLFGLQFTAARPPPRTPEEQREQAVSRALVGVMGAAVVLLMLL